MERFANLIQFHVLQETNNEPKPRSMNLIYKNQIHTTVPVRSFLLKRTFSQITLNREQIYIVLLQKLIQKVYLESTTSYHFWTILWTPWMNEYNINRSSQWFHITLVSLFFFFYSTKVNRGTSRAELPFHDLQFSEPQ